MHLLLLGGMAAEVFVAILRVQHGLAEPPVGSQAGDEGRRIAGPALPLLVPHGSLTSGPRLLREHVDRVIRAEEFADPPGRVDRARGLSPRHFAEMTGWTVTGCR